MLIDDACDVLVDAEAAAAARAGGPAGDHVDLRG